SNRRFAASVAAMASVGHGDAVMLRGEQRMAWRMQGIEWLRAELGACNKQLEGATPEEAASLLALQNRDPWLAYLREIVYFAGQPAAQRDAFRQLSASSAQLYSQAFAVNPKLESDMQKSYRFSAACCAALATYGPSDVNDT